MQRYLWIQIENIQPGVVSFVSPGDQVTKALFMIFSLIVAFEQLFFYSLGKRREALAHPTSSLFIANLWRTVILRIQYL